MTIERHEQASAKTLKQIKRKVVRVSKEALVETGFFDQGRKLPLVIRPKLAGVDLAAWAGGSQGFIEAQLQKYGAILFRDFNVDSVVGFNQLVQAVSEELLDYSEPSSPRIQVADKTYTSTEYPASQWIQLHNEMSYAHNWPHKVFFFCVEPADEGGATPLARSREVFELLPPSIRDPFIQKRVMYVRNFGSGLDIAWQKVFQTEDRSAVELYCRSAGIDFEWADGNRLRTRQVRQGVLEHPRTGEVVWFNQAHAFHVASLDPQVRESLMSEVGPEDIPRNAYYGDGSTIDDSVIEAIIEAYSRALITFEWRKGDVLMVENMLVAHGRMPFKGTRKILVSMAELVNGKDIGA